MPETLSNLYTSEDEIKKLFSQRGLDLHLDDDESLDDPDADELESLDWVIDDATDEVNLYVWTLYAPADLANNRKVRSWATWIACYFLSQRKGDPALWVERYDKIIEQLTAVRDGNLKIPRVPVRTLTRPELGNQVVDQRFNTATIRTQQSISVGQPTTRQFYDYNDQYPEW